MRRTVVSLPVADLSSFTLALGRALRERVAADGAVPSHQSLMNLVARAAGFPNVQAVHAATQAPRLARVAATAPPLTAHARKALEHFDAQGRLVRWPTRYAVQRVAMWMLWMPFEARRLYTEREVNGILKAHHTYGDHVTLRRELVNHHLLARTPDGSEYRKLHPTPDDEARAAMRALRVAMRVADGGPT